jgi:two-component system, LytTR family, sensor kinase
MLVSAAWTAPAIFAIVNRVAQTRVNGWDPVTARELIFTGGDWFLYALLIPGVFAVSQRWPLVRAGLARRALIHLGFALLFCVAWALLGKIFEATLALIFQPDSWKQAITAGSQFRAGALRNVLGWILITLPYGTAVYLSMVGVEHAIRYFTESREQALRLAQLSQQLADARLATLQAQLNPHFLFNALNTIAVHAREGDGARTARIVEQLSGVLRRTLSRDRGNETSLDEELELVREYLAIEGARFPDRLRHEFDVPPELLRAAVPGFALQTLVENAVRHGIAPRSGPGLVRIVARKQDDILQLDVIDDGIGFDPAMPAPAGHGIANTRDRLSTLYGSAAGLRYERRSDGGMTARLAIPYHEALTDTVDARA